MNTKFVRIAVLLIMLTPAVARVARAQEVWTTGNYSYDGAGNIVQIGPDVFLYDRVNRLASATVSGTTEIYKYDSFGNLTGIDRNGQPLPFPAISPQTNRFLGEQYDAAGNMKTSGNSSFVWDALNALTQMTTTAGAQKRFIYTADDERIGVMTSSSVSRWTIRDFDGKVLREFRADGANAWTWEEDYAYGEGKLVGAERPAMNGGVMHFHLDHLGTPRLITNASALKLGRHDYYPFGIEQTDFNQEMTQHNQDRPEPMRFTGHQRDFHGDLFANNSDYLDYMHARYYNPALGRFLSIDPARASSDPTAPQSWNRYSYAGNHPVNSIDPNGLWTVSVGISISGLLAGAKGEVKFALVVDPELNIGLVRSETAGGAAGTPIDFGIDLAAEFTNAENLYDLEGDAALSVGAEGGMGPHGALSMVFDPDSGGISEVEIAGGVGAGWEMGGGMEKDHVMSAFNLKDLQPSRIAESTLQFFALDEIRPTQEPGDGGQQHSDEETGWEYLLNQWPWW